VEDRCQDNGLFPCSDKSSHGEAGSPISDGIRLTRNSIPFKGLGGCQRHE